MTGGLLRQLGQKGFDLALDGAAGRPGLSDHHGRVQASLQFDQPVALALELPILRREGAPPLHDRQQLLQQRMPPFCRLRWSEASRRAKSSNTRNPPSSKGGLLPSVRVTRSKSA